MPTVIGVDGINEPCIVTVQNGLGKAKQVELLQRTAAKPAQKPVAKLVPPTVDAEAALKGEAKQQPIEPMETPAAPSAPEPEDF
jgi:electron transfer flavoprotein alpha/beta subunit